MLFWCFKKRGEEEEDEEEERVGRGFPPLKVGGKPDVTRQLPVLRF